MNGMQRRTLWPLLSPKAGLGHSWGDVCGNEDTQPAAQMIALGRVVGSMEYVAKAWY